MTYRLVEESPTAEQQITRYAIKISQLASVMKWFCLWYPSTRWIVEVVDERWSEPLQVENVSLYQALKQMWSELDGEG